MTLSSPQFRRPFPKITDRPYNRSYNGCMQMHQQSIVPGCGHYSCGLSSALPIGLGHDNIYCLRNTTSRLSGSGPEYVCAHGASDTSMALWLVVVIVFPSYLCYFLSSDTVAKYTFFIPDPRNRKLSILTDSFKTYLYQSGWIGSTL